jgi:hypothetical protein
MRVFEAHSTAYIVMDLEDDPTLKAWLAEEPAAESQAEYAGDLDGRPRPLPRPRSMRELRSEITRRPPTGSREQFATVRQRTIQSRGCL